MNSQAASSAIRLALIANLLFVVLPASGAKVPQVDANHLRWEKHDAVLSQATAWQEERSGSWVTVVLLTDRPVPREALGPGRSTDDAVIEAKAQGIAFAVTSGGVPSPDSGFNVWFRDGTNIRSTTVTGEGGFEIESQSATRIKGRAVLHANGMKGSKSDSAFDVSFDAPVLRGDAKRMAAEGEPLGATGGQPAKDLQAAQEAKRKMDFASLSAYGSPDLATFLQDKAARQKNLEMLKGMTSPQMRILGGVRSGDRARVYWVAVWPDALDSRCIDDMVFQGGKWRSVATACQAE
jgi:hypothetical protein